MRSFAMLIGVVLALGLCGAAVAQSRSQYPRPCPSYCGPSGPYGFNVTKWRQWPGEPPRMEEINPQSINREVLLTPRGQERVPLPRGTAPQQTPSTTPDQGILPPQDQKKQPESPLVPATPNPSNPPTEGGLQGLPFELDSPVLPALPKGEQPKEGSKPKDTRISPTTSSGLTETLRRSSQRPTAAIAVPDKRDVQHGTVLSLVGSQQPDESRGLPAVHRASTIVATEPESLVSKVSMTESAAQAEGRTPTVALGGYCPVALLRSGRWAQGDLRWTVVHEGRIYRLSGPEERQQFKANPDAFAPACSGNDPVLAVNSHRTVPGQTTYCAVCNGRLYMFSSAETQAEFNKNPRRYVVEK